MQIRAHIFRKRTVGAVLVTTLVLTLLLGATLLGYLSWVRTQNLLVAESQAWNAALVHAEAGIEDALAQINVQFGTNFAPSASTNWGTSLLSGYYGPRTNNLSSGSYATVFTASSSPTLYSTGYATVPFVGRKLERTIKVTTRGGSAFVNTFTVRSNLTTKGNGLMVDSYDSADPLYSTNGMYYAPWHKAGGDIASTEGFINVQNANIYGHLLTGPTGSYSIGANGSVGDLTWNVPGQIEPGWYRNDLNFEFKDVTPPFSTGLPIAAVNVGTNTYVLASGNYYVNGDFVLNQNETLYISAGSVCNIYVTGNFNMKSQNACYISMGPGANLRLYVGTSSGSPVATSLTQVNNTGNAGSFQYYGLPSNNTLTWNGNTAYVGTIYAPQAVFSLGGGGSTDYDFQGACVAGSAVLNGHFNFHYDENLKRNGVPAMFTVLSWEEL